MSSLPMNFLTLSLENVGINYPDRRCRKRENWESCLREHGYQQNMIRSSIPSHLKCQRGSLQDLFIEILLVPSISFRRLLGFQYRLTSEQYHF